MKTDEIIMQGLQELSLAPTDEANTNILKLINKYLQEIMVFNKKFNLVGDKNAREIIVRHILDSLAGFSAFKEIAEQKVGEIRIADVGTGAGLPGIPLAIALDCTQVPVKVTLIERMKKRCTFLHNVKAVLNLKNVEIVESDIKDVDNSFDIITCRAFTTLTLEIFDQLNKLRNKNGKIILYKGELTKTQDELRKIGESLEVAPNYKIKPIKTPFLDAQRCLAIIG